MSHKAFADSLRVLAEWYEAHPEVPLPCLSPVNTFVETRAEMEKIARAVGNARKNQADRWFWLSVPVAPEIEVHINIARTEVCTPRVVGQRVIPAKPEHTEEVIEWECHALLDDAAPSNVGRAE